MTNVLRMPGVHNHRLLLDPISKLVSYALQNCTVSLQHLAAVCYMCNRAFTKERDKLVVTRTAIFEFTQALKFKVSIPDSNFLLLADLILRDSGGAVLEEMGASSWCGLSETRSGHYFNFYRLTPVSKPVNKRLVKLFFLLLPLSPIIHNVSKPP